MKMPKKERASRALPLHVHAHRANLKMRGIEKDVHDVPARSHITSAERAAERKKNAQINIDKREARIKASTLRCEATLVTEVDHTTRIGDVFTFVCGCDAVCQFEATLGQLDRKPHDVKGPWCPQCRTQRPALRLADIIKEKNGELIGKSHYIAADKKVHILCKVCDNPWTALPHNIFSGSWCPSCAKGTPTDKAENRLAEIAAERGDILHWYGGSKEKAEFIIDGHGKQVFPNNYVHAPSVVGSYDLWAAYDWTGNRAFVWGGDLPEKMPRTIVDHLQRSMIVKCMTVQTTELLRRVVKEEIEGLTGQVIKGNSVKERSGAPGLYTMLGWKAPMEVLNVAHNAQWKASGVYSWGAVDRFHNTLVPVPELSGDGYAEIEIDDTGEIE